MMQGVNIVDVLKKPTELAPEVVEKEAKPEIVSQDDFQTPPPKPPTQETKEPEQVEDDFNYENSAEAMIDMIDTFQKSIFILLGARKIKRKIPAKLLEEMQIIDTKDVMGEALTDAEKKKLDRYKAMSRRMELLMKETPFSDEEIEEMQKATTAFAHDKGIKIPPGVWFGAKLGAILSKRVIGLAID